MEVFKKFFAHLSVEMRVPAELLNSGPVDHQGIDYAEVDGKLLRVNVVHNLSSVDVRDKIIGVCGLRSGHLFWLGPDATKLFLVLHTRLGLSPNNMFLHL